MRQSTHVVIADSAQIGVPLMSAIDWGMASWKVSPDGYVSHDTLSDGTLSEDFYQNESYGSGIHLHEHWVGDNGEGPTIYRGNAYGGGRGVTPTDTVNTSIDAHEYSSTAGRVYGNTTIEVNGGHIYHDVFGGGSLASVGTLVYKIQGGVKTDPMGNVIDDSSNPYKFRMSKTSADSGWHDTTYRNMTHPYYVGDPVTGTGLATVIVRGGIIGTRGINEGGVFGSGRGIAGGISSSVAHLANANNTEVYIRGAYGTDDSNTVGSTSGADIRGAVFGGGANGHVTENTYVEMTGGTVGVSLPLAVRKIDENTGHGYSNYNGNVYGGGRGVSVVASTAGGATEHLSSTAGRVFGNTRVKISGGLVYHSVFGGGSLASVGTYSYKLWNDGDTHRYRHLFVQGTGQAVVHITGDATIGNAAAALEKDLNQYNANDALTAQYVLRTQIDNAEWHDLSAAQADSLWNTLSDSAKHQMFTELNYHYLGSNSGMVFGSGRGVGALHNGTIDKDYVNSAFTRNTIVIVEGQPVICGSVFGGGENGHVKINTHVDIKGGIIGGIPLHNQTFHPGLASDNGIDGNDSFRFSDNADLVLRLEFEDNEDNAGHGPAVYRGNVYGGGRGVDHTDAESPEVGYSATAGRVYGDVEVHVTGGMIYHHVFGGGSLASVGTYLTYNDGVPYRVEPLYEYKLDTFSLSHQTSATREDGKYAMRRDGFPEDGSEPDTMYVLAHEKPGTVHVDISGGQVGVTGINEGSVFGGGRGIAGRSSDMVTHLAYCYQTDVNIKPGAKVRGSVFGGGANGHVLTDATVTMTGGTVGVTLDSIERVIKDLGEAETKVFHGNVYGGGRGVDPISSDAGHNLSYTAGRVYGDATVKISGGTVLHNVYGGGSLATVGTILYRKNAGDQAPGSSLAPTTYDSVGTMVDSTGRTSVTIYGTAVIGDDGMNNGSVFGSCRGMAGPHYSDRAYVSDATVTIKDNAVVHGSAFGSGENGHVMRNTNVNVQGSCTIGTVLPAGYASLTDSAKKKYDYIGNVYGAGRGVDSYIDNGDVAYSYSAGYVRGSTFVTVSGTPTIYRNVYGGGSMGLVGDYGVDGSNDFWKVKNDTAAWTGDPTDNDFWDNNDGSAHVTIQGPVGYADYVAMGYGGNVYGSSRGVANDPATRTTNFAAMAYVVRTNVSIENGADVKGNVYGGGENGHVDWGGTTVNIIGGTVAGNVFGGGRGSITSPTAGIVDGNTQVNIGTSLTNGNATIGGDVFAGNDTWGSPLGTMRVDVWSTAHTDGTGGNPDNRYPTPPAEPTPLGNDPTAEEIAAYNAALAVYNAYLDSLKTDSIASNSDYYALNAVYGGGNEANILTGVREVDAKDGNKEHVLDSLYITQRIKNYAGAPVGYNPWPGNTKRKSVVYIHGCDNNTVKYVYGGGRAANTIENEVIIEGGRIYQVFAGGDGHTTDGLGNFRPANVGYTNGGTLRSLVDVDNHGDATLTIDGGIVYQVFGGSNTRGEVYGEANVTFSPTDGCQFVNSSVFGGGNEAPGAGNVVVTIPCGTKLDEVYGCSNNADFTGNVTLNIEGGILGNVYGGSKGTPGDPADIDGNVEVNFYGGHVTNLFGGSNVNGNITGTITVNIDFTDGYTCPDGQSIDNVYGGGNMASYEPNDHTISSPEINLINGTVNNNVFGGGLGYTARVWANPVVNIGGSISGKQSIVLGCIYGGGNAAPVDGSTTVKLNSEGGHIVTIGSSADAITPTGLPTGNGDIFGGGLGSTAIVSGNTSVGIFGNRTTVYHNVYGGGNAGVVQGGTDVQIGTTAEFSIAMPTISIGDNGMVTITSKIPGVTIRYTIDGTTPTTESGTVYDAPFQAEANQVIKAVAYRSGYTTSPVATSAAVPIPVPTINADRTISLSAHGPNDATIYYTLDGSEPTDESSIYTSGSISATCGQTIKAIAVKATYTTSAVSYSTVATPTISLSGSTATISCATTGATLRYTLSETAGTPPANPEACTTAETVSNGGTVTVATGKTLKVIADMPGFAPSGVATATNE